MGSYQTAGHIGNAAHEVHIGKLSIFNLRKHMLPLGCQLGGFKGFRHILRSGILHSSQKRILGEMLWRGAEAFLYKRRHRLKYLSLGKLKQCYGIDVLILRIAFQ